MIEVEMSKDIRDFQTKLIGPFTKRQLICIVIGLAYGVPLFFIFGSTGMDIVLRVLIPVILMTPTIACGWVNLYGMPLEKFMVHIIKTVFFRPKRRLYQIENVYLMIDKDVNGEDIDDIPKKVKFTKEDNPIL